MTGGILAALTIIVAVFASGVAFPGLENSQSLGSKQGNLTVLLMDAPVEVDELWMNITEVMVHKIGTDDNEDVPEGEEPEEGGWIQLDLAGVDKDDLMFNLLEYQINEGEDDKVLNLAGGFIDPGSYNKLRLNVTWAEARYYQYDENEELIVKENGYPDTVNQTLRVPPNKIEVITEFKITPDDPIVILIDMEPDLVGISKNGNLRPVIKATISQNGPEATIETIESTPTGGED